MTKIKSITKYYKINDLPSHQQSSHEAELHYSTESTLWRYVIIIIMPHRNAQHKMWTICYSVVCLSIGHDRELCWNGWTIKMLFGVWTHGGPSNHVLSGGPDPPSKKQHFWRIILKHAQTCPRPILSMLFSRGHELCGLRLPVYCSSLL